jgi:hypothetical protein
MARTHGQTCGGCAPGGKRVLLQPTHIRVLPLSTGRRWEGMMMEQRRQKDRWGCLSKKKESHLGMFRGLSDGPEQDRFRGVPGHIPASLGYLPQSALHCSHGRV